MKHLTRLFVSLVVPAFILAGVASSQAMAQDKAKAASKATNSTKVLHEDDRVRVTETTTKPGERGNSIVRGFRVTRWLQGGTQERTYADGKKEKVERKTGEVSVQGPDKQEFFVTNIGKTTMMTYAVNIKAAKK
jgi:hypothetical protein